MRKQASNSPPVSKAGAPDRPRSDVFGPPPPERQLPTHGRAVTPRGWQPAWFWVAAHGGAGCHFLTRVSRADYEYLTESARSPAGQQVPAPGFALSTGRAWPNPQLEPTNLVVVVCKTTMHGLMWARDVARQYLAGLAPVGLRVLGLVTIADQPGRLPRELEAARALLGGAYGRTWHLPYVPAYRLYTGLNRDPLPPTHPDVAEVLDQIRNQIHTDLGTAPSAVLERSHR